MRNDELIELNEMLEVRIKAMRQFLEAIDAIRKGWIEAKIKTKE